MKKILFWDFDGVIADSFSFVALALIQIAKKHEIILTKDNIRKAFEEGLFWASMYQFNCGKTIEREYS